MPSSFSFQAASAGIIAAIVGFVSAFPIVLQGLGAAGASPAEAASGLFAVTITMGVAGIHLSLWTKQPISVAWSTPGAALLVTTGAPDGGFAAAVGAFLVSGMLLTAAGLWKPIGRAVATIPASIANAMLAGVLVTFCLGPVKAMGEIPAIAGAVILIWLGFFVFKRLYAAPAAMLAALVAVWISGESAGQITELFPAPVLIWPEFSVAAIISIAIPLFLVTMASQNVPGVAVLKAHGYEPNAGPLFATTGLYAITSAPFGGHAVNLAAITAAICAGPDAHRDPARRYWASVVCGAVYLLFGLLAGAIATIVAAAPPVLITAVAGLALIGAFANSLSAALLQADTRIAAAITFVVASSGLSFLGIGSAFWGLAAGLAMVFVTKLAGKKDG